MPIGAVGGVGGVGGLGQLAETYRQQVITGGAQNVSGATGSAAVGGIADGGAHGTGTAPARAAAARGADFASAVGDGLQQVENLDRTAADKAVQAATGDLTDVHDYVIAATQAQVATELTTTVRNKALEAFNEIMRMPL